MIAKETKIEVHTECRKCLLNLLNEVEMSNDADFLNVILFKQNACDYLTTNNGSLFSFKFNET